MVQPAGNPPGGNGGPDAAGIGIGGATGCATGCGIGCWKIGAAHRTLSSLQYHVSAMLLQSNFASETWSFSSPSRRIIRPNARATKSTPDDSKNQHPVGIARIIS